MNSRKTSSYWKDSCRQLAFLQDLSKKLGIKKMDDWYTITNQHIRQHGGRGLLKAYHDSHVELITKLFPDHKWQKWKFVRTPHGYWESISNQRVFFEAISEKLPQVSFVDKWYPFTLRDLKEYKVPEQVLNSYKNVNEIMRTIFPEHVWEGDKFKKEEDEGIWNNKVLQRQLFDQVASKLNITHWEGWYNITIHSFQEVSSSTSILRYFNGSLIQALKQIYPEHPWKEWKFIQTSDGFWDSLENQRLFLSDVAITLNIKNWYDWLHVTLEDVRKHGGSTLLLKYKSIQSMLFAVFPEYNWKLKMAPNFKLESNENIDDLIVMNSGIRSRGVSHRKEDLLYQKMKDLLFPSFAQELYLKYTFSDVRFPDTNKPLEIDIFIPQFRIGIEYQGRQHYQDIPRVADFDSQQRRDTLKKQECLKNDIALLEVEFNKWDGSSSTLSDILLSQLVSLLQSHDSIYLSDQRIDAIRALISHINQVKLQKK